MISESCAGGGKNGRPGIGYNIHVKTGDVFSTGAGNVWITYENMFTELGPQKLIKPLLFFY